MYQKKSIIDRGDIKKQIFGALGAHGKWKTRLHDAAETGTSEWDPETVKSCHNCEFGKWLDAFPNEGKDESYTKVFALHDRFHKEAARVLAMALSGATSEAKAEIAPDSEYAHLSLELSSALMEWRDKG